MAWNLLGGSYEISLSPSCSSKVPIINSSCPFCGLLCDDLSIVSETNGVRVSHGCSRAERLFDAPGYGHAMLEGKIAGLGEAYRTAAAILANSRRPLVGGLACDVLGHRAAFGLAETIGAVVDHMNGRSQFRNVLAFQDGGWMSASLSEVRNRADLIVLAGTNASSYPRFIERTIAAQSQFGKLHRKVVILGAEGSALSAPAGLEIVHIPVEKSRLDELFAVMRIRASGRKLEATEAAGLPIEQIDSLLDMCRSARYGVLAWNAAELDFPDADLAIRAMADFARDLNRTTRWSVFPMGGNDGDVSAAQVCTWQTGYPLRIAFDSDGPRYEPLLFAADRLLERQEVDALLWVSALDPERVPPDTACPRIVLGRPDMRFEQNPDVFIPVAVPGVHHDGFMHRMDGIVAFWLQGRLKSELPTVAEALSAIQKEMKNASA